MRVAKTASLSIAMPMSISNVFIPSPSCTSTISSIRRIKKRTTVSNRSGINDIIHNIKSSNSNGMALSMNRLKMVVLHNQLHSNEDSTSTSSNMNCTHNLVLDYINALRPITILQAVGALIVGYLALTTSNSTAGKAITNYKRILIAATSVYLSYGCGMVINDIVDVNIDSSHEIKQERAFASGRISQRSGWIYCTLLSLLSLGLGFCFIDVPYTLWTGSNLGLMFGYAFGLQRVFLLKNIICGWLAISPLIGAAILGSSANIGVGGSVGGFSKLLRLATVGFPLHVAREILKDIEDVEVDRLEGSNKVTIPLVMGEKMAHRIAYAIVGIVCSLMVFTPWYWNLFIPSKFAIYPLSVFIGVSMCAKANQLPVNKGQQLLKKSIFILLVGMISSLLSQQL